MSIKNWYQESVFKQFGVKVILFFCIAVIFIESHRLYHVIFRSMPVNAQFFWVSTAIGTFFIIASVHKRNIEEKIAFLFFGLAFIVGSIVRKFIPHLTIGASFIVISFEIIGTIGFLEAYKKYKNESTNISMTLKIVFVLLALLLPAIFFWILGMCG